MNDLMKTLSDISEIFNGLNIKWSVGGSVLLSYLGLHENPHDIDIITAKEDIEKAKTAFERIGTLKPVAKSSVFVSDRYYKFDISGVEVDLISGFKIRHEEGIYEYRPEFENCKGGCREKINYASVEDWYVLYLIMPKGKEKAQKIENYFKTKGKSDAERLKKLMKESLPYDVKKRMEFFTL